MTVYLRSYLEEIKNTYNEARKTYTELFNKADEVKAAWIKARSSGDLNAQGLEKAQDKYLKESADIQEQLESLISSTKKEFAAIRRRVDADFASKFKVNPDNLDMPTLELLKSGILKDSELSDLAGRFNDNITMLRLIGKYAQERADQNPNNKEIKSLAVALKNSEKMPHLEATDTLIFYAERGLRPDRITSDGIAAIFDENADRIISESGDITAEK